MKTISYDQPPFYHFSQGSIRLASFVAERLKNISDLELLDAFAGCGVVGIETSLAHGLVKKISFVEKQADFFPSLVQNTKTLSMSVELILGSAWQAPVQNKVIISNPPFYGVSHGREPKNLLKRQCHFIDQQDWALFVKKAREARLCFCLGRLNSDLLGDDFYLEQAIDNKTGIFSLK